jgi:hypothetical protein
MRSFWQEVGMRRMMVIVIFGALCGGVAHADVSTEEKSQVKFAGMLGRMMNLFGGGAARDGIVSTMAVKGDRKVTRTDQKEQIVDLKEEKVYNVDLKDKSYTVTTFADMRKQMEEAQKKAAEQAQRASPPEAKPKAGQQAPEMDVDFSLKESGAKKAINGFDAREVVMTIAVREKGKTLEQNGGLVMTTSNWLTPKIAAMKEVADFDRRFAEKLALPTMIDAQQMATVMAMYPGMKDAMKRLDVENVKLDGTAVLTTMTVDAVASAEQTAQAKPQPKEEAPPASLGGLAGRLARRAVKKDPEPAPAAAQSDNRATFMTVQHEVLKVSPTVTEADLQIPAGFKLKN